MLVFFDGNLLQAIAKVVSGFKGKVKNYIPSFQNKVYLRPGIIFMV